MKSDEALLNRELWSKVLKNVRAGIMPPEKKPAAGRNNSAVDMRIASVVVQGPLEREQWVHPKNFELFFTKDAPETPAERRQFAREALARFTKKTCRRPVDERTLGRLAAIAEDADGQPGKTVEEGIGQAMVAVLVSPQFLFRVEDTQPGSTAEPYALADEYALASRLSYFLWSTMPDNELLRLAERGKLRKNLPAQIARMLDDSRSEALIQNFFSAWRKRKRNSKIGSRRCAKSWNCTAANRSAAPAIPAWTRSAWLWRVSMRSDSGARRNAASRLQVGDTADFKSALRHRRRCRGQSEGEALEGVKALSWLNHGRYVLKGVEEPLEICEVGEVGAAVLKPPPDSEEVHRYVSPDAEPVLGWRPALGQVVPGTQWVLEDKLGEGGFGEVWVGRHEVLKERRVFKFCFRADRVRALKRDVTLFRLLKERIGEHSNIVRLHEVFFNEPPFYIEMEYVKGRDLKTWSEERGGLGAIPQEVRLEIVAQVGGALQAAHDAGVIHRDVKPSNILLSKPSALNTQLTAKLTDFRIGQVVSQEALAGLTKLGFTQTMMSPGSSAQTGTQLYMAPEVIAGKTASIRSDIYSLGVVFYQLLIGDFSRPLATDWAKEVSDPLLREGLALIAWNQRKRAEKEKAEARRLHYVANMNLAQQSWEQNNVGRLPQLLGETHDYPDRGFEWFYWQRQTHLELRTMPGLRP